MLTGKELDDHARDVAAALGSDLQLAIAQGPENEEAFTGAVGAALQACLDRLAFSACWGPTNRLPSSLVWNPNARLLELGSLQWHARRKPLGYAGDYQLLDRICRTDCTNDPVGSAMDHFFQSQAAPQAVRNRCRLIASNTVDQTQRRAKPLRVVSIGSGPGWDIDWAIQALRAEARQRLRITLVDIDPRALEFCETRLKSQLTAEQVTTIQANLGRLPRLKKVLAAIHESDFVYCAGYFDYLDDVAAVSLLHALWGQIAKDGELLVFNFNEDNPSRAYMEWIGNWYLRYRTPESLRQLADQAQLAGANVEVGVEPAGVNLFLRCIKR